MGLGTAFPRGRAVPNWGSTICRSGVLISALFRT